MKQSKFNVLISVPEKPECTILYNSFHDHRLILDSHKDDVEKFFQKVDCGLELTKDEKQAADLFKELGVLLEHDVDEVAVFDEWFETKIHKGADLINVIIVTTMACNLRCPYCFEKNQLDNSKKMTSETAEQICRWLKDTIVSQDLKKLKVTYFGGEPLMNKEILYQMSSDLSEFCEERNIVYDGGMITNGVLLTPEVARQLRKAGLTWFKVTLDGDKETHNLTRISEKGWGSFDRIMSNLERCNDNLDSDEVPLTINIGGNFNAQTFPGFIRLLDRLEKSSFRPYIGYFHLKPIQDMDLKSIDDDQLNTGICDTNCFTEENTHLMSILRAELRKRNLPCMDHINMGPCDFYRGDSYSLGMDGHIYTCPADFDIPEHAIGHVDETISNPNFSKTYKKWEESKPWTSDCYDCSFLPVCVGGCQAKAYASGYDWNSTVCEKEYFKRMSKTLAKELLDVDLEEEVAPECSPSSFSV